MKKGNIRRAILSFIPFVGLLGLCCFWIINTTKEFTVYTYGIIILLLLIFAFSLYFKLVDYKNVNKGLNIDDEFSTLIREKSGRMAFSWSIYLWLFILCFVDMEPRSKIIICLGLIGMGFLYNAIRFYFSKQGLQNEN